VPKPVPDDQAVDESAATQAELGAMSAGAASSDASTSNMVVDEAVPDRGTYVAMERTPEVVRTVKPEYPEIPKKAGIEGKVYLQLLIDHDGHVMRVEVARSSGNSALDEAAVDAAKKILFTPAIAPGGKTVRVWVSYPVTFSLRQQ
jgi:protein TonB